MNDVETALKQKREELYAIEAPEEMEARLRQAIPSRKRRAFYKPVAAVLIAALVLTYSFDTLAYYGKKFTGYDQMIVGSLQQLNELGRGQEIGRSYTFSNGVEVTVDGIMFDDNELVVFYKARSNGGNLDDILDHNLPRLRLYGIKPEGYFPKGGQGMVIDDRTMSFIDAMEPPKFYEKWMGFDVELNVGGKIEKGSIGFTLDRSRAMKRVAGIDLNAEAEIGDYRIVFDRLTASMMSTVLNGRILPKNDAALKAFKPDTAVAGLEIPQLRFDIISDDGEVSRFSGGQSVSGGNISFSNRSDALPKDFKTLQIGNIRLETMQLVDKTLNLDPGVKNMEVADDLVIKEVYQDSGDTFIMAASRGVPVMGLFEGENQLEQVDPQAMDTEAQSEEPVERVYRFKGTGQNLKLAIKYIRYSTFSSDKIDIPIG